MVNFEPTLTALGSLTEAGVIWLKRRLLGSGAGANNEDGLLLLLLFPASFDSVEMVVNLPSLTALGLKEA